MRSSFDKAFELTIGLEGKPVTDEGGYTIWGLASKWNNVNKDTTVEQAKSIYLKSYWIPAGCDDAAFPMDICLFDSQVNPQNDKKLPGGGNQEILLQNPSSWQDYNLLRMIRYKNNSKSVYVDGHIMRVIKLSEQIKKLELGG
jgi:hypothetical protein